MILTPEDAASMTAKRVAQYPVGTVIIVTQTPYGGVTARAFARERSGWFSLATYVDGIPNTVDAWGGVPATATHAAVAVEMRHKSTVSVQVFTP